jgi:4-amino-4-deoxy-L-arabinose transferase-like glycosyltransferase
MMPGLNNRGAAPDPARGLCPLDPHQGQALGTHSLSNGVKGATAPSRRKARSALGRVQGSALALLLLKFLTAVRARLITHRRPLLLAAIAIAMLWPGITRIPPLDRDESRYAQATAQMLETGNYVDVRFQEAPRYLQPAGIYWLQAAAVSLLSTPDQRQIWANRVPGALAAVASVLLTWRIGTVLYGPTAGFAAGLLLALSVLLGVESRMATIDATLLAVILVAQSALLEVWRRRDDPPSWVAPLVFWAANGAGVMLKGPVILLVTGGTLLGLAVAERQARWMLALRPRLGSAVMLAIVLPWMVAIAWVSGGAFFDASLGHNFLGKVAQGQQAHGLPPGTYLALFVLTFWPGSLFAARTLPFLWSTRRAPETRFLLAWIVPTWAVFEAVATKLPHYVLPTYPAIALLTAGALCVPPAEWGLGPAGRAISRAYGGIWLATGLALAAAGPVLLLWLAHRLEPVAVLAALVAGLLAVHAARQARKPAPRAALACAGASALVISLSAYLLVLPGLQTIWLSPRIAAAVKNLRPCPDSVLASASYAEPSLVYLAGRDTKLIGPAQSADFLHDSPACGLALIDARDTAAFLGRARALGLAPRPLTRIDGISYSTGRRLALTLYAASPPVSPSGGAPKP